MTNFFFLLRRSQYILLFFFNVYLACYFTFGIEIRLWFSMASDLDIISSQFWWTSVLNSCGGDSSLLFHPFYLNSISQCSSFWSFNSTLCIAQFSTSISDIYINSRYSWCYLFMVFVSTLSRVIINRHYQFQ